MITNLSINNLKLHDHTDLVLNGLTILLYYMNNNVRLVI